MRAWFLLSLAVAVVSATLEDEAVVEAAPEEIELDPKSGLDPNLLPFYPYPHPEYRNLAPQPFPEQEVFNPYLEQELRNFGGGLGVQLGPLGAGLAAGVGPNGVSGNLGLGFKQYQYYGTPGYYKQFYSPSLAQAYSPNAYSPAVQTYSPAVQTYSPEYYPVDSRTAGFGGGFGAALGPLGVGLAGGLGQRGVNFGGGAGFNPQYQYYGTPSVYKQYYSARPIQYISNPAYNYASSRGIYGSLNANAGPLSLGAGGNAALSGTYAGAHVGLGQTTLAAGAGGGFKQGGFNAGGGAGFVNQPEYSTYSYGRPYYVNQYTRPYQPYYINY